MQPAISPDPQSLTVEARAHGWRIDHYLCRVFPNYSRALFQKAIEQQAVLVNGLPVKGAKRLRVNDLVSVRLPQLPDRSLPPEDIPLDVVYEDDYLVVINKAAGMIVHPGRGHYHGTLAGALQFHFNRLSNVAGELRPGIVHRLDRDTSGILIVAKDNTIHSRLSSQFEQRLVQKEYRALTHGRIDRDSDYIETHMRVNPQHRERMCVCPPGGSAREASTFYEVLERFDSYSYVRLLPKTGRTHQLRVHMRHLGHPIMADRMYGGLIPVELAASYAALTAEAEVDEPDLDAEAVDVVDAEAADDVEQAGQGLIARQALHAFRLQLIHPVTQQRVEFEAPLPPDFEATLRALRQA